MNTISDDSVIHVDFGKDERPKYLVLQSAIRAAIRRGDLASGTRLPPVRDLAWKIGVTPGTIARAYSRLVDDGTLTAVVGRGTFVAEAEPPAPIYSDFHAIAHDSTPHGSEGDRHDVSLLSPHLPSVGQAELICRLMAEVAGNPPSGVMHYPVFENHRPAREAAHAFLDTPMLGPLEPDDITLTHGGQHGISLVLQAVLTGRRPVVLVEDLSYPGYRRMAEMLRAEVVAVAIDDEGIIPEALALAARPADAQILCLSPEVQNPTCTAMSDARRRAIADIARACDLQILEDDCYVLGVQTRPSLRLLAPERTWHVSSIAKSITPALRLGFAIAPPTRRMALRRAAEYNSFGIGTPLADMAAKLLVHPELPALMAATRESVATYVETAAEILAGHDLTWRTDVPFLWLGLPVGWRASAFCRAAEAAGVKLRAAEEYAARDANAPHAVRFAINAGVSLKSFGAAIGRLRALLDNPTERMGV